MGLVGIDQNESGGPSVFDLPKLEPQFTNEKARVVLPAPERIFKEWRHTIGGPYGSHYGFAGNWICSGRDEVLKANGLDPEACVACRLSRDENYMATTVSATGTAIRTPLVSKPKRKFVTQLFRYNTDPTGMQLMQPFGAQLLVWQFSDQEYRALVAMATAWGDLRAYDMLLNCKEKSYKTWEPSILPQAYWLADPSYTAYIQQAYANGVNDDITRIIGRPIESEADVLAAVTECMGGGAQGQGGMNPAYAQQMMQPGQFPGGMPGMMPQQPQQQFAPPPMAMPQPGQMAAPPPVGQPQALPLPTPPQAPPMAAPAPMQPPPMAQLPQVPSLDPNAALGLQAPPMAAPPQQDPYAAPQPGQVPQQPIDLAALANGMQVPQQQFAPAPQAPQPLQVPQQPQPQPQPQPQQMMQAPAMPDLSVPPAPAAQQAPAGAPPLTVDYQQLLTPPPPPAG